MWNFVCDEWHAKGNSTACSRDENNLVTLTAYVRNNHVELIKNCFLFEIHYAQYQDKCMLFRSMKYKYFMLDYEFSVSKYNNESAMRVKCPKKALNGKYFKLNCMAHANDTDVMDVIAEPGIQDNRIFSYSQFWYFFLAMAISWIGMAVVVSVGDAICFELLGKRHELYGNQRLWGAVGWGVFSIIAGIMVDEMSGFKYFKNYSVIYFLMAAALLPDMLVSGCLEVRATKSVDRKKTNLRYKCRLFIFTVQAKRHLIKYHQRCGKTIQIAANYCILHLVYYNWILHGIGLEFPILAFGRSGR